MKKVLLSFFIFHFSFFISTAFAGAGEFDMDRWYAMLNDVQTRANAAGISNHVINDVIGPAAFIPSVVQSDQNQAEFKLTLDQYLARAVNDKRIAAGRDMRRKYPGLLTRVERDYGLPAHVILAFWGMESNYGEFKAKYKLSDAFLTLIYDGRREKFFDRQLFALMKYADKNDLEISEIYGSWAGAMGHFQFIPTTLEMYGADGDGDGKVDIIHNVSDAMCSAGNYLSKMGWDKSEKIARAVSLPAGFDTSLCDGKTKKPLNEWRDLGVVGVPNADMVAGIVCDPIQSSECRVQSADDAKNGQGAENMDDNSNVDKLHSANCTLQTAYLTYPNFYRIKKWNNSNWYALAVANLADQLK